MENFPANSHKDRDRDEEQPHPKSRGGDPEKPKVKRITQGDVIRRKEPLGKKFKNMFIGGDARSVWSYIFGDVLIPAAKDMIADAGSQGLERMIFGETRSRMRRPGTSGSHVPYNRYSSSSSRPPWRPDREPSREISRRARVSHDFDEIVLPDRGEAEAVIDQLFEILSAYEMVSVSDLYEMVGITGQYTDEKWGWTDLRGAGVTRTRAGYLLDLPKPEPLN